MPFGSRVSMSRARPDESNSLPPCPDESPASYQTLPDSSRRRSSSPSSTPNANHPNPRRRLRMCKSKKDTLAADPRPNIRARKPPSAAASASAATISSSSSAAAVPSAAYPSSSSAGARTGGATGSSSKPSTSTASTSSHASLASLREFLPESLVLYPFSEIRSATNNFLAKRLPTSSSNAWRCTLRGKDAVVFQRRFRGDPAALRRRLAATSKVHHSSIAPLLGASLGGRDIYLVYEHINGASLADCLRNPRNPGYTPLSSWVDRMQVATDLAQGLEYIHFYAAGGATKPGDGGSRRRPFHGRITSSTVVITDPQLRAKICHFGAAKLAGEDPTSDSEGEAAEGDDKPTAHEISEVSEDVSRASPKLRRSGSREVRIEGTRGYIAPEILDGGRASHKSDVFAFGVLLLELLTGEEPVKYQYNRETKDYERISLVETAKEVMGSEEVEEAEAEAEVEEAGREAAAAGERHRRIRRWVDRRLKDSYPVEVAERAVRVALECLRAEAEGGPDMERVAGKMSRLLLKSRAWADQVRIPGELSVSMAPR